MLDQDKEKQQENKVESSEAETNTEKEEQIEEIGGPETEPTTYGDWQFKGRVSDF